MVNFWERSLGSKGVRAHRLEEPPLGNLAPPADLEESALHHCQSADLRSSVLELPKMEVYLLKWFLP